MKTKFINVAIVFLLISITGCASSPRYKFTKNEPRVEVTNSGYGGVSMCKDYKYYTPVSKEKNSGVIMVPAGDRITLMKNVFFSGYNVSFSCYPRLSFIPKEGEKYIVNADISPEGCYVELVKLDGSKETGISVEPSVAGASCYQRD